MSPEIASTKHSSVSFSLAISRHVVMNEVMNAASPQVPCHGVCPFQQTIQDHTSGSTILCEKGSELMNGLETASFVAF